MLPIEHIKQAKNSKKKQKKHHEKRGEQPFWNYPLSLFLQAKFDSERIAPNVFSNYESLICVEEPNEKWNFDPSGSYKYTES